MEATTATATGETASNREDRGAMPPIAEPHMAAWHALMNAHDAMTGRLQEALAEASLPPLAWYAVLSTVAAAPEERMRMGDLANALVITRGGLTKLVDRLVKSGLLERAVCDSDRRISYASLLPAGREMLGEMEPIVTAELERAFVGTLSPGQAEALRDALERVSSSVCAGG
jgi:DNA-binding MarR family transcriptional regulator